jgi:hypothetical protein
MRANDGPRDACIASWVPVAYGTAATSPLAVFLEFREFRHKRRTKCGQHEGSHSSSRTAVRQPSLGDRVGGAASRVLLSLKVMAHSSGSSQGMHMASGLRVHRVRQSGRHGLEPGL